jgi:2-polyprenyl-3-methyl-5-hydroxy-6-metoxy-1,4-benzoquinol methylase
MYQWDDLNPKGYNNRMGKYKTKVQLDFILKNIGNSNTIFDMGGGSGRFAIPLIKLGFDVTVIDLDQGAIDLCKKKGIKKAICGNVLDYNQERFDAAIAMELFLVTEPDAIISHAYNILNPEGVLIFTCVNKNSWRYKLRKLRKNRSYNYDKYSYEEYLELISKNRFEIIETKGFVWMPFKVNSNNILIPVFAKLEKFLRLSKWLSQSPSFIFYCKKKT